MSDADPYRPPEHESSEADHSPRLLLWSAAVVFGSTLIGGIFGLVIGASLGTLLPSYYQSVFANGGSPEFDPVAVGIGQGLTQGIAGGAAIGLLLVAMYYWYRSRKQPPNY